MMSSGVSVFNGLQKMRFETACGDVYYFISESDAVARVSDKIEEICLNCHVKKSFALNCNNCPLIKFKNEVLK